VLEKVTTKLSCLNRYIPSHPVKDVLVAINRDNNAEAAQLILPCKPEIRVRILEKTI